MGIIQMGDVIVHGNFAEVLPEKPKEFDYNSDAKWIEPYSMEWREVLGDAVCNCTTVEVHFAPYYGFSFFHRDTCNLMRKIEAQPGIANLYEVYLPSMTQYHNAVENTGKLSIWVHKKPSRAKKIKVKRILKQLSLV